MRATRTRTMGALLAVVLAVGLLLGAGGCSGVLLAPEYDELLDRTTALADETADRAVAGDLTAEQMARALRYQADTWRLFQQARDGEAPADHGAK